MLKLEEFQGATVVVDDIKIDIDTADLAVWVCRAYGLDTTATLAAAELMALKAGKEISELVIGTTENFWLVNFLRYADLPGSPWEGEIRQKILKRKSLDGIAWSSTLTIRVEGTSGVSAA